MLSMVRYSSALLVSFISPTSRLDWKERGQDPPNEHGHAVAQGDMSPLLVRRRSTSIVSSFKHSKLNRVT